MTNTTQQDRTITLKFSEAVAKAEGHLQGEVRANTRHIVNYTALTTPDIATKVPGEVVWEGKESDFKFRQSFKGIGL